jgi:hypothetical protein
MMGPLPDLSDVIRGSVVIQPMSLTPDLSHFFERLLITQEIKYK